MLLDCRRSRMHMMNDDGMAHGFISRLINEMTPIIEFDSMKKSVKPIIIIIIIRMCHIKCVLTKMPWCFGFTKFLLDSKKASKICN